MLLMIERWVPENREEWLKMRALDVTSTESAALFGISPYLTEFELWHRKKNSSLIEFKENERTIWGTRLQDAIAKGIAEDEGWTIRKKPEYVRDTELRMGASFDFQLDNGFLLEIKNVDSLQYRDQWIIEKDSAEAPAYIELQVQHQLAVDEAPGAYIGGLIGGNRRVLLEREPNSKVIAELKARITKFWSDIHNNIEPEPNFARDAAFIAKLYSYAEPGKVFDASEDVKLKDLATCYKACADTIKELEVSKARLKSEILMHIGEAEKVIAEDFKISVGLIGPAKISYEKSGYRMFKLHWRKRVEEKAK